MNKWGAFDLVQAKESEYFELVMETLSKAREANDRGDTVTAKVLMEDYDVYKIKLEAIREIVRDLLRGI